LKEIVFSFLTSKDVGYSALRILNKIIRTIYFLMKIILESERLLLREFKISDAKKMYQLNSDPDVIRYTGDGPFDSIESAVQFLENYSDYSKNGFGRWVCIDKKFKEFIGWCGLKKHQDEVVDIGYRFFKKDWGKGFATESAKASLEYGFKNLNLPEIIGRSDAANIASIHVLKKLNMQFWKKKSIDGIGNALIYKINKYQFFNVQ